MDPLVTELATDQNFDAQRYLLVCADVAEHYANGLDPWQHFDQHGRHEGRRQLGGLPRVAPEARPRASRSARSPRMRGPI